MDVLAEQDVSKLLNEAYKRFCHRTKRSMQSLNLPYDQRQWVTWAKVMCDLLDHMQVLRQKSEGWATWRERLTVSFARICGNLFRTTSLTITNAQQTCDVLDAMYFVSGDIMKIHAVLLHLSNSLTKYFQSIDQPYGLVLHDVASVLAWLNATRYEEYNNVLRELPSQPGAPLLRVRNLNEDVGVRMISVVTIQYDDPVGRQNVDGVA